MLDLWKRFWLQPTTPEQKRDSWHAQYCVWAILHFSLGFLSILLPAVASATKGSLAASFAVAATVTSGVVAFLKAQDRKDKFNVAWLLLAKALQTKDLNKIAHADIRGESIINADSLQKYAPDEYEGPPDTPAISAA